MSHPLEDVINNADGFLVIGHSGEDRFPAFSYHAYSVTQKRFYCLDIGKIPASRGKTAGGKVYHEVDELPDDVGDLAILWVHPRSALRAVNLAGDAGCTRIWFSFQTATPEAVARARELGMEIVEIGRCPVYYLDGKPTECVLHTKITKFSGTYKRPPQTDLAAKRRELW